MRKFKKHKNAAADMERQDKVGLRMWACFSAQRAIVSLQVVRKGSQYLCDDRFKDWLKVEGEGEGMKMWCWVSSFLSSLRTSICGPMISSALKHYQC